MPSWLLLEAAPLPGWFDSVAKAGLVTMLFFVLYGGFRRWWVWGWAYDAKVQECDMWRDLALGATELSEESLDAAKTLAGRRRR